MKKIIFWLPRILAIIYILFISVFALDIFGQGYDFWEVMVGLFMHLIPSLILIVLIVVAWRRPKIGGILFIALAVMFTIAFNTYRELITLLLISGPLLLIGILFLLQKNPSAKNAEGKG
jgi:hypothetical protein